MRYINPESVSEALVSRASRLPRTRKKNLGYKTLLFDTEDAVLAEIGPLTELQSLVAILAASVLGRFESPGGLPEQ